MQEESSNIADAGVEPTEPTGASVGSGLAGRVRSMRAQRGWSLKRMSELCGVSQSMLSQIERNEANPTIAVTLAIATTLGVTLDELVLAPEDRSPLQTIRGDDPYYIYSSDDDRRIRTLSPMTPERQLEFYEVTLQRGGELRSAPHFAGTREHLTVQKGRVRIEVGDHHAELAEGDSSAYPADGPHAIVNIGRGPAVVYLIDTVP